MFSDASTLSGAVDEVFFYILGISVLILIFITSLMVYFVCKYSREKNKTPAHIEGNLYLEIFWIVVPTFIVISMFYVGFVRFKLFRQVPENSMKIKAIARKWSWLFEYENGKKSTVLKVPLNKSVKILISSLDVIHSLYIPAFRVKEDAVPGRENYLWFQAVKLGSYDIFCAEYCGLRHSYMLSKLEVISRKDFSDWLKMELDSPGKEFLEELGCLGCHVLEGPESVAPSFRGLFGRKERVITNGIEREIVISEAYIRRSLLNPLADVVVGFEPVMPSQEDILDENEIKKIINILKNL